MEIARFECRTEGGTFSLLPVQLIPYHQYTAQAILCVVLLAVEGWAVDVEGCSYAVREVEHDAEALTPWLVACWLKLVAKGLEQAHGELCRQYDLTAVRSDKPAGLPWATLAAYAAALWGRDPPGWPDRISAVVVFFSHRSRRFLFGVASQHRAQGCA